MMATQDQRGSALELGDTKKLTCDELIRTELAGKFAAVERYDSMLWKIRSGYVVVLYGGLAILGSTGLNISAILGNTRFLAATVILIWGFSLCGFLIDIGFSRSKLRVVIASNQLYTLALKIALGKVQCDQEYDALHALLENSGESLRRVPADLLWNTLRWLLPLYFGTPIVGTFIYGLSVVT
jgi:hypothetical protein